MCIRAARVSGVGQVVSVLALLVGASACQIPTRVASVNKDIPRDLTPIAINAGLTSMEDPATKTRIAKLVASPETKDMEREVVAGVVDGTIAALGEKDRAERAGVLTSRYAVGMLKGFTGDFGPQMGPIASDAMRGVVKTAMTEAMSDQNQRAMTRFVSSIAQAGVQPVIKGLSDAHIGSEISTAMTKDLGPAFQRILKENLAPGIGEALQDEKVQQAIGLTARTISREMVLGSNDALKQIQASKPTSEPSLIDRVTSMASQGKKLESALTWAVGLVAVILAIWVVKLVLQVRRYRTDEAEAEATARKPQPRVRREPAFARFKAHSSPRQRGFTSAVARRSVA